MKKIRWHFILFWVVLFLFWYCAPTEGKEDFDTRLIHKLSEMLKVEPPKKILVERLDQKEMLGQFRKMLMVECMDGKSSEERFRHCVELSLRAAKQTFIHGIWIEEKDPTYLHLKVYKRNGPDVIIHEYLHWYLHHLTEPNGLVNSHDVLTPMANQLLTSEEIVKWLEKEGG